MTRVAENKYQPPNRQSRIGAIIFAYLAQGRRAVPCQGSCMTCGEEPGKYVCCLTVAPARRNSFSSFPMRFLRRSSRLSDWLNAVKGFGSTFFLGGAFGSGSTDA